MCPSVVCRQVDCLFASRNATTIPSILFVGQFITFNNTRYLVHEDILGNHLVEF